jgi:hypothetical protein
MRRKIKNSRRFKETSSVQHTVPKIIRNALKCRHRTPHTYIQHNTVHRTMHSQNHNRSY